MKFEHKLAIVAGSVAAPGFAQALSGRRRAALIWMALVLVPALLGTLSIWFPMISMMTRLAAGIAAFIELRRYDSSPVWWHKLSIAILVVGVGSFVVLRATIEGFKIPSSSMYPTLVIGDHIFVDKLSLAWRPPERGEVIVFRYPCAEDRDYVKRVIAIGGDTVEVRCNVVFVNSRAIKNELVAAAATYQDYDDMQRTWFARTCSRYRETHGAHTFEVFHDPDRPARDREGSTPGAEPRPHGDARDFPQRDRMIAPSCSQSEYYPDRPRAAQPAGTLVVTNAAAAPCEQQAHFVVPANSLFVMGDNRNNANDSRYWGVVSTDAVIGRVMGIWLTNPPGGASWSTAFSRVGALE